jgi:biopolymer transport protein ExbB
MNIMTLGGWMMWPLLAVSVMALAVIVERALAFAACPLPDGPLDGQIQAALRQGDIAPVAKRMRAVPLLREFATLMDAPGLPRREAALRLAGEQALGRLERRLALLSTLARLAPLMGLLGTITGMIGTFAHIAEASTGVDMTLLAAGIWQALITTAAGLCIAIPAQFSLSVFSGRARRVAQMLDAAGNTALMIEAGGTGPEREGA